MKHFSVAHDAAWEDDNRWFAAHPGRQYRLRRLFLGEFDELLEPGPAYCVLVGVIDAENRLRIPFAPDRPIPRDLDAATDEQLSGLFDIGDKIAQARRAMKRRSS